MPYEIYMDIKGYEGIYQVSNLGNIRNSKGKVLKPIKSSEGYMQIVLCKNGEHKRYYIHRLVLSTFKANPENKPQVNHINEDKTDNRLNNLEWNTPSENINHGTRTERASKSMKIKIKCIELNQVFDSATDAALYLNKKYNGAGSHIADCCNGKRKSAYGYTWKYANSDEE